ncbi:MAG: hypothetical protein ACM3OO_13020 [Planctomycetaceae bacterium]
MAESLAPARRFRPHVVPEPSERPVPTALRAAFAMSGVLVVVMVAASAMGLFVQDLYAEGAWAREALRGGDLVTLVLAAPLLLLSLLLSMRGSRRAQAAWVGMLAYGAYNYAFYTFGSTFNDAFALHIAAFSLSVFALACAVPNLDRVAIAGAFGGARAPRGVGWFLAIVGVAQGGLWSYLLINNVVTGDVMADIPVSGQHLVFALDLGLMAPSMVVAGVLLARKVPIGYLLGAAMALFGAVYQVNMMVAGVFQANADVAGVKAFPPEGLLLTTLFWLATALLFWPRRTGAA